MFLRSWLPQLLAFIAALLSLHPSSFAEHTLEEKEKAALAWKDKNGFAALRLDAIYFGKGTHDQKLERCMTAAEVEAAKWYCEYIDGNLYTKEIKSSKDKERKEAAAKAEESLRESPYPRAKPKKTHLYELTCAESDLSELHISAATCRMLNRSSKKDCLHLVDLSRGDLGSEESVDGARRYCNEWLGDDWDGTLETEIHYSLPKDTRPRVAPPARPASLPTGPAGKASVPSGKSPVSASTITSKERGDEKGVRLDADVQKSGPLTDTSRSDILKLLPKPGS